MRISKFLLLLIISSLFTSGCNFSPTRNDDPTEVVKEPVISDSPSNLTKRSSRKPLSGLKHSDLNKDRQTKAKQSELALENDIWLEIATNLQFERDLKQKRVITKLQWFKRNQAYLDRVSDRARPYLHHIVSELKKRNMPLDLALLPIVESAYQPFAQSPSHASGIWQFIPATGKRFGLKQNWWYDGRRDIVAATDAALNYLSNLHKRFDGDWLLAIAAYNTGEGNIERAVKRNLKAGKKTDFWSLKLHRETLQYVPNLLAIAEIVAKPEHYNITLKSIENRPYFKQIDVGSQIDLATVAELSQLTMDEVYTLNPGFSRWATDPDGPHRILTPLTKAVAFQQKLAALPKEQRMKWQRHVIKSGDTLGQIANRYGSNITALKQANKLKSSRIRAGHSLLIPVSKQPLDNYTLSQQSRLYKGLKRDKSGQSFIYKIKRGDTLWDISRLYGVSVNQLCSWNNISQRSTLRLGQALHIRIDKEEEQQTGLVKVVAQSSDQGKYKILYQVQNGDSLWLISRRFGVSVNELRQWNKLVKNKHLQPGQNLDVYTLKKPAGA